MATTLHPRLLAALLLMPASLAAAPALAISLVQEIRLEAAAPSRHFGSSPAIDGDTAVFGYVEVGFREAFPAAAVFTRTDGTWQQQAAIVLEQERQGDYKDVEVDVDYAGGVLVVAASRNGGTGAHVYTRGGTDWVRRATLAPEGGTTTFVQSVATDGQTVLVDSSPGTHVYTSSGDNWVRQATFASHHDGQVEGDTVVFPEGGSIAVFRRAGSDWPRQTTLTTAADVERIADLELDGDTIIAIGRRTDGSTAMFAFRRVGGAWQREGDLGIGGIAGNVAVSADVALVAHRSDPAAIGQLLVLERRGGVWQSSRRFPNPHGEGMWVALDGDRAAVTVPRGTTPARNPWAGLAFMHRLYPGIGQGLNLHCAADADGDGNPDLTLVTAQREVLTRRLDGSPLNQFVLGTPGHLLDTALMADTNTNGAAELGSLLWMPSQVIDDNRPAQGEVWDLQAGTRLAELTFAPLLPAPDLALLDDLTGNGIPEAVALSEWRPPMTAYFYDTLTAEEAGRTAFSGYVKPRSVDVFPDLDGNGRSDLAVLSDNGIEESNDKIELRDPVAGAIASIWLGRGWMQLDQRLIGDLNGNGSPEVAVLREHPDGRVNVQVRDLDTRGLVSSVDFTAAYSPRHLLVVPDVNGNGADELVVFGPRDDGFNQKAVVRDGRTGQWLRDLWFDRHFPGRDFVSCGDLDGNGADDVALLGYDPADGRNKVIVKDTATGQRRAMVRFW